MYQTLEDTQILLFCEELLQKFQSEEVQSWLKNEDQPLAKRLNFIRERIETERRLIEELSRPARLILEHFTMFLEKRDYTIGLLYGDVHTGRGLLSGIHIGKWGTIHIQIGDISVTWRDADVGYMFYADRIVIRPKDSAQDDINFFFSYSFKYNNEQLKRFSDVQSHEKTLYWHESLSVS